MHLLPWLTEEFHSPLPPAELLRQLQVNVMPAYSWRDSVKNQPSFSFRGQLNTSAFKIVRIPQGRGSMQPVIEGQVSRDSAEGSQLRLRYRLSWLNSVFAVFWLSVTSAWVIAELRQPIISNSIWGALILLFFGLLLFIIPFWWEVKEARQLLRYLLKLEILAK